MEAVLQRLEKTLAASGDMDDTALVKRKGTSLDPPSYDTRSLFSMFSATNTAGQGQKRLVDMDQLLNDANARLKVNDRPIHIASREERKEKMRQMGSHSRHMKNSRVLEKCGEPRSLNQSTYSSQPSYSTQPTRKKSGTTDTPLSYHGFLAKTMRRASWETGREQSVSPLLGDAPRDQSVAILREIYQV